MNFLYYVLILKFRETLLDAVKVKLEKGLTGDEAAKDPENPNNLLTRAQQLSTDASPAIFSSVIGTARTRTGPIPRKRPTHASTDIEEIPEAANRPANSTTAAPTTAAPPPSSTHTGSSKVSAMSFRHEITKGDETDEGESSDDEGYSRKSNKKRRKPVQSSDEESSGKESFRRKSSKKQRRAGSDDNSDDESPERKPTKTRRRRKADDEKLRQNPPKRPSVPTKLEFEYSGGLSDAEADFSYSDSLKAGKKDAKAVNKDPAACSGNMTPWAHNIRFEGKLL